MRKYIVSKPLLISCILSFTLLLAPPVFADTAGVGQIESFIQSIIQVVAGLAGLVATGFFVIGGFGYITSSGNPEHLSRAKRTLIHSGIGLAIVIGAFVISSIITSLATKAFAS